MVYTTEKLIETVKKYPVLYDTSHHDYKHNKIKNKIWDAIAERLQEKDGDTVKSKWKNLRDSYSKHLRSNKNETGKAAKYIERYKTWPWIKQMSFLQSYLECPATQSNSTIPPSEVENNIDQKFDTSFQQPSASSHKQGVPFQQSTSILNQDTSAQGQNSTYRTQHRPHKQRRIHESQIDKFINYFNNKSNTEYDDIDLIFLGYSKTIKKMSMRLQASVKFSIARIIMEAELKHAEQTGSYDNVIKEESTPLSSPTAISHASQDYYAILPPSDNDATANDFPDTTETIEEHRHFSYMSSAADPLHLKPTQNFSHHNDLSVSRSDFPKTVTENVTNSQTHCSLVDSHECKSEPGGKKMKLYHEEFGEKS